MSEKIEILNSKIALLKDQIDNLERSGFFTEAEINKFSAPLQKELHILKTKRFNESRQHFLLDEIKNFTNRLNTVAL